MAYKNYAPENDRKRRLFRINERVRKGSNDVVAEMRKRLEQMRRTKKYHRDRVPS